jgi:hypothetical protein
MSLSKDLLTRNQDDMSKKSDLLKAAKREKTFATLARIEGRGAKARSKHSTGANKADNKMEAKIDETFAKKRGKIATAYKKQALKIKGK